MATLPLRLSGPVQAWGTQSRFYDRDTRMEPSKSGVVGLICAALGRPRDADLQDLAALRMAVRVDREGSLQRDYQTAGAHSPWTGPYPPGARASLSNRYYLAGACFLVLLEGDEPLLRDVEAAIAAPRWQLCLGRKACTASEPILLPTSGRPTTVSTDSLESALERIPWLGGGHRGNRPARLRVVMDGGTTPTGDVRTDVPLSFAQRTYADRSVETFWMETPE